MLEIGSVLDGKYKILNKIGQGGMSVVYLAMNERANKPWAVKEVRKNGVSNFEVVKQGLVAETDILKRLNHPSLPSIVDIIETDGSFIIVMDYIEGRSLQDALKHYGAQQEEDVIEWAKQLCDVLGYLHNSNPPIIYRDMKPSNVMLKPDGNVTLIDFGTAREFKSTSVADTTCLGTQGYAAPEQFGGQGQTDGRTDIYCLGATMYHLVTGHNPAEPPYEMYPIRQWNPALSSGLEEIILKCTQRNPDDRYQNCNELMYALEHYKELDIEYKREQKRHLSVFLLALVMTILFAVGGVIFSSLHRNMINSGYDGMVSQAEREEDFSVASDAISRAVKLQPGKGEAYLSILENAKNNDGVFSKLEQNTINNLLRSGDSSSYNEIFFKNEDPEKYAEFCYRYGLYLCFLQEDSSAPYTQAEKWFRTACDYGNYLDENYREIAELMHNITAFLSNNDAGTDAAWDSSDYRYSDMWEDWSALIDSNKLSIYGERVPAAACKFFLRQIGNLAREFQASGISSDEMYAMIDKLEMQLVRCGDAAGTYRDLLEVTRDAVESASRSHQN